MPKPLFKVGAVLLLVIITGATTSFVLGADEKSPLRITGTYSDMRYVPDAGDVIGTEIKIVFTGKGFQGALQIAEGSPGTLMLVEVEQKGNSISFSIPEDSPYAGAFHGSISGSVLRGDFQFKTGGSQAVVLRKGKSYWD